MRAATEQPDGEPTSWIQDLLAPHARGWAALTEPAKADELRWARSEAGHDSPERRTGTGLDDAVQALLVRLALGDLERVVVVDIDVDGLWACEMHADPSGVVTAGAVRGPVDCWNDLLPSWDAHIRRYLLAGGVIAGASGRWRDPAAFTAYARKHLRSLGLTPVTAAVELVLLRRRAGWRALDELATALRDEMRPGVDAVLPWRLPELGPLVAEWCAAGPLRQGFDLAVVTVATADGRIGVATETLVRAGAPAGHSGHRQVSITLRRTDGGAGPVILPVLRAGTAAPADRPAVAMPVLHLPGAAIIEFTVRAPGQIKITAVRPLAPGARPSWSPAVAAATEPWSTVVAGMPLHNAYDVVIAVELGGARGEDRIEAARNVVRALDARENKAPGAVRVAVVGFEDHPPPGRIATAPVCRTARFAAPADLLDPLSRWHATAQESPFGSAVEDALHLVGGLRWRSGALHTLVVVGSRPPGVLRAGPTQLVSCPNGHAWRRELAALRAHSAVRTVAIVDLPGWYQRKGIDDPVTRTDELWDELGRNGRFALDGLDYQDAMAVIAPGPQALVPLAMVERTEGGHGR